MAVVSVKAVAAEAVYVVRMSTASVMDQRSSKLMNIMMNII